MTKQAKDMTYEELEKVLTQSETNPFSPQTPFSSGSRDFLFGKVWKSDLSWREKRLISLTCTAIAAYDYPLETHVYAALKSGDFALDELHAWALHVAAYGGFPMGAGGEAAIAKACAELEKEGVKYRRTADSAPE